MKVKVLLLTGLLAVTPLYFSKPAQAQANNPFCIYPDSSLTKDNLKLAQANRVKLVGKPKGVIRAIIGSLAGVQVGTDSNKLIWTSYTDIPFEELRSGMEVYIENEQILGIVPVVVPITTEIAYNNRTAAEALAGICQRPQVSIPTPPPPVIAPPVAPAAPIRGLW